MESDKKKIWSMLAVIVTVCAAILGEVRGWWGMLKKPAPIPITISQSSFSGVMPVVAPRAEFIMTSTPMHLYLKNPPVFEQDYVLTNLGDGIASDVTVFCGDALNSSHGLLGTVAPKSNKNFPIYETNFPNDVLHHEDLACSYAIRIDYKDDTGEHLVSFDEAGQAKPYMRYP